LGHDNDDSGDEGRQADAATGSASQALEKVRNPALIAEERAGGVFLRPVLPTRDIPKKQIKGWLARDEAEMATFRAKTSRAKADVAIPASHRAELDRRLKRLAKAPEPGRPWPAVRRELLAGVSFGEQLSDLRGALRTRQAVKTLREFGRNRA
jgi:hypothetical protein